MSQSQRKGIFIVIDGTDGSGKGTQTVKLVQALRQDGFVVELTDFPQYGHESAWFVEQYLNGNFGTIDELGPYKSSVFYAVDRFAASKTIESHLRQGKVVISNRYVTANMGHQGAKISDPEARKRFYQWLYHLEYHVMGIPQPDVNLVLHVPARIAQQLVDKKPQRRYLAGVKRDIHEDDLDHLQKAESVYIEMVEQFDNMKLIECMDNDRLMSPEEIHALIFSEVKSLI